MARKKGSRNRTTLERELTEAGFKGDVSKMSYEELATNAEAVVTTHEGLKKPSEPVEQPIVTPEQAREVIADTRRRFDIMVDYYTSDEDAGLTGEEALVPERIQEFLRVKVFMAPTIEVARAIGRRALEKLHTHLLMLWTNKRISGPDTTRNIEKRAAKAEKWAKRLEKLGRFEDARRQREKVAAIRATPPTTANGTPWLS